jgi:outer membrane receptor for Fe3+-dicitrate
MIDYTPKRRATVEQGVSLEAARVTEAKRKLASNTAFRLAFAKAYFRDTTAAVQTKVLNALTQGAGTRTKYMSR